MSGLTVDNPIKFVDVINSKKVLPGDTLLLRGGTYKGYWTLNIGGTKDAPVTIQPYQNEPVVIDGGLTLAKPHLKIMDMEITDSNPDRTVMTDSITMNYPGCWIIGCHIHDLRNSGVNWFGSGVGGIVECWIYENGFTLDGVEVAHGIYSHNADGGARLIARNLFGNQRGKYTIHLYSGGDNYLNDFTCEDNVIFGDAVHTGGGYGLENFIYRRNIQCGDYCQHGRYTKDYGQNNGAQITDNLFVGLAGYSINADSLQPWLNLTESGNTVWSVGGYNEPSNRAGYTVEETPTTWSRFVPFTLSEPDAALVGPHVLGDNRLRDPVRAQCPGHRERQGSHRRLRCRHGQRQGQSPRRRTVGRADA